MAAFPGNLSLKMAHQLQTRVVSIPWVRKCDAIRCLGRRDLGSSVPVRYVPKVPSKRNRANSHEKPETPPAKSPEMSEAQSMSNADAMRYRVYREGKGEVIVNDLVCAEIRRPIDKRMPIIDVIDAAPGLGEETIEDAIEINDDFIEGIEADVDEIEIRQGDNSNVGSVLRGGKSREDAENLAFQLLATRAYTAVAMTKKLQGKRFPPAIVEAVVNDFKSRGFINDGLYAETYSRSRWSSSCWGPRRIKQELFKKGVSKFDAEKAVKLVFEECDSSFEQESRLGLSKVALDHLFSQASKQWLRSQGVPVDTRKSRIVRWLQYRGFNWGVINVVLRKLESQA
ncbi:uncharacterized protein LOC115689364 isoform X1 [Syzygium oleosum]|uniref:uncharacterized protein LOC115689364 isoform X1 n=1 Tax=Syzygium oleosum TaxID=219896 RepID=UPI0011D26F4E|nr:uncharacterized protein LOC115689364 isoform X1 [Syzygium oleosum]